MRISYWSSDVCSSDLRDLRLLSARPSPDEEARAEHRLFGHIDGGIACSAAAWADDARREIAAVHAEGRLPILVGGTGLHIQTLIEGIAPAPPIGPEIRKQARDMAVQDAYAPRSEESHVGQGGGGA